MFRLDVGTGLGQTDIYTSTLGAATMKTITGIPLNGSQIYVRLWSNISGVWQSNDYTYITSTVEDPKAYLINPEPGSKLTGSSITFTRTNTGAAGYWLDVGIQRATGDIFGGSFSASVNQVVNNIPSGSQLIYVRLWTLINGAWQPTEYTFTGP